MQKARRRTLMQQRTAPGLVSLPQLSAGSRLPVAAASAATLPTTEPTAATALPAFLATAAAAAEPTAAGAALLTPTTPVGPLLYGVEHPTLRRPSRGVAEGPEKAEVATT